MITIGWPRGELLQCGNELGSEHFLLSSAATYAGNYGFARGVMRWKSPLIRCTKDGGAWRELLGKRAPRGGEASDGEVSLSTF